MIYHIYGHTQFLTYNDAHVYNSKTWIYLGNDNEEHDELQMHDQLVPKMSVNATYMYKNIITNYAFIAL